MVKEEEEEKRVCLMKVRTWADVCRIHSSNNNTNKNTKSIQLNEKSQKNVQGEIMLKAKAILPLLDLPSEIILQILASLPIEDIFLSRVVCKSFYMLTKEPHFIDMQLSRSICQPQPILLLNNYSCSNLLWIHLESNVYLNQNAYWRCKQIPTLPLEWRNVLLYDSCNGMLCLGLLGGPRGLKCRTVFIYIYNPITKDSMQLPLTTEIKPMIVHDCSKYVEVSLGHDFVNKKYKVVRVYYVHSSSYSPAYTKGEIITLGESSWRALDFPCTVPRKKPVFLNGAFHWLIQTKSSGCHLEQILVLDIIDEKFYTIKLPHLELFNLDLINFRESLALIENNGQIEMLLRMWQIEGSSTSGGRIYERTYDVSDLSRQFESELKLLGLMSDGSFLFKGFKCTTPNSIWNHSCNATCYHLALYNPQTKRGFVPRVRGKRLTSFQIIFCTPSLVSPSKLMCVRI